MSDRKSAVSREVYEAMLDSQYRAGAKAGWNAAQLPEPEAAAKIAQLIKVEAGDLAALRHPKHLLPDAARIADALELCDWSGCSIGNKEILKAAVATLRLTAPQLHQHGGGVEAIRAAAEAVIAQWDTPNWKLTEPTAKLIEALRAALAQQPLSVSAWQPIAEADNGIAYIVQAGEMRIGNSYPIWVRDADGRVYEALWSDNGKNAYWWDIEGESPVDPVEFMPHPLSTVKGAQE